MTLFCSQSGADRLLAIETDGKTPGGNGQCASQSPVSLYTGVLQRSESGTRMHADNTATKGRRRDDDVDR